MGCCGKKLRQIQDIALGYRRLASGFTAEWADERIKICDECNSQNLLGFCKECWCFIRAKVLVERAACDLKKWSKIYQQVSKQILPSPFQNQKGTVLRTPKKLPKKLNQENNKTNF